MEFAQSPTEECCCRKWNCSRGLVTWHRLGNGDFAAGEMIHCYSIDSVVGPSPKCERPRPNFCVEGLESWLLMRTKAHCGHREVHEYSHWFGRELDWAKERRTRRLNVANLKLTETLFDLQQYSYSSHVSPFLGSDGEVADAAEHAHARKHCHSRSRRSLCASQFADQSSSTSSWYSMCLHQWQNAIGSDQSGN